MTDKKLSELPTATILGTDLLYTAHDAGAGTFTAAKQSIAQLEAFMFASGLVRQKLTANLDLYISPAGSDTLNTGMSLASPWQTLQKAFNHVTTALDVSGFEVIIHMAAGTYTGGRLKANITSGEGITLINDSPGTVTFNSIIYVSAAQLNLNGTGAFTFVANSAAALMLAADIGGTINCNAPLSFAAGAFTDTVHFYVQNNGTINISSTITITGTFNLHLDANVGGFIQVNPTTHTFVAGATATNSYIASQNLGYIVVFAGQTFVGTVTGVKHSVAGNAILLTFGQTMPGTLPGVVTTGGEFS